MTNGQNRGAAVKQIITALLATIPTFTYGIQIGWLSPNGPLLKSTATPAGAPLTPSDVTWMAAALPLAAIAGIPFFSHATDRFGRKKCIVAVSLLSCVSWIIKLNATAFVAARVIAGLAAGGCFVVVPAYIKEISEDSRRGALGSLVMTVCKIGVIVVYALALWLGYSANQWVFLVLAAGHAIVFLFMPESPSFLVKRGRDWEAAKTIAWLRNLNKSDKAVIDEIERLKEENRRWKDMPKISLVSIVRSKPAFSALRITLTLMGIQTLSGCFAIMNYASDVFKRAGTDWSPNTLALLVGGLQLAGSFFTTMSIDRFGRKIPLAGSSLAVCLCMSTLATCFLLPALSPPRAAPQWLPVTAVCVCMFAYGAGLAPVPFVVMAEVFSFELRAKLSGASMAFSFLCSALTVLFYTPVATSVGPFVVFYTFGAVCLFGVVYTVLCVPETKGKSLAEIQANWRDGPAPVYV